MTASPGSESSTGAAPGVRVADPAEYGAIGELTADAYATAGFDDGDSYLTVLRDPASRPADCTVLAVDDAAGRLLGAMTYIPAGSTVAQLARDSEVELRMLAVRADGRGQGVAGRLIRDALVRASAAGRTAVVLCVVDDNTGARALYERLGFVRDPERDWSPVDGLVLVAYRHLIG